MVVGNLGPRLSRESDAGPVQPARRHVRNPRRDTLAPHTDVSGIHLPTFRTPPIRVEGQISTVE